MPPQLTLQSVVSRIRDKIIANYEVLPFVFFVAFFVFYLSFDNTPPHWDSGRHLYNSFQSFGFLKQIFISTKQNGTTDALTSFLTFYSYYPPFVYWITLPFLAIFKASYHTTLIANLVWVSVLFYSIKSLLSQFNVSKIAQFVTLAFVFSSPFIVGNSRELQLDVPVLAVVFLVASQLERINQNFNLRNFIWLSIFLGIGLMTKWSFIIYTPILLILWGIRIFVTNHNKANFWGIFLSSFYILLSGIMTLSGIWYVNNLSHLSIDLGSNGSIQGIKEGDPQGITLASLKYIFRAVTSEQFWLLWVVFGLIIIALAIFRLVQILKTNYNAHQKIINSNLLKNPKIFLVLSAVLSLALMLLYHMNQGNKDYRYLVIFYFSWVVFFGVGIDLVIKNFQHRLTKQILVGFACLIFVFNHMYLSSPFNLPLLAFGNSENPTFVIARGRGYTNNHPEHKNWAIYQALETAKNLKNVYIEKNDSCISKNYWYPKPTILADFDPQPLHTNTGTVWGLAEQYQLEIVYQNSNACFIIVGRELKPDSIYPSEELIQGFNRVSEFGDSNGFNLALYKKNI